PVNSGWELVEALYINDSGRIIGVGNFGGVSQWFILDLTTGNNPPVAVAGSNQTVDCQSQVSLDGSGSSDPNGDTLSFEWSVGGNVLGTTPVIAVSLPLGTNVVTLKVSDPCGAYSKTNVTVIVVDNTPPTGSCPASATVSADSNCQAALPDFTRQVVATDNCTPSHSIAITQSPAAGTLLGLGQHPVTVTVTDGSGNSSVCTVLFTVVDKTAPTILSVPSTFTLSAGANCQAQVPNILADVAASDSCTPANQLIKSQNPAAGTLVGLGDQNIVVTVSDAAGNSATADVHFKVADTTAPSILSAPSSVKISADGSCQGVVPNILSNILAMDNCTPVNQLVLTQNPAPGTVLAHGVYSLSITASDLAGNSSSVSVPLEIADTTAPVIECLTATPNVLTPPNHQLVSVSVSAQVADNCDSAPAIKIISITCNEVSAPGDMQITGAMTAMLAASKASTGNARIYTITVQATDSAGNSSTSSVIVTVPKNGSTTLSNSIRHSRVQINSTRPLNA
ncbi:MAG TPA: HYR domain-containing protein, partial [Patescibacteria group bacterium]|nr:HYR domain-containing protein [Patescibacteria group bacterium]